MFCFGEFSQAPELQVILSLEMQSQVWTEIGGEKQTRKKKQVTDITM